MPGSKELPTGRYTLEDLHTSNFQEKRKNISEKLFFNPSYTAFDAMGEMTVAAETYLAELSTHFPDNQLWVGGSLGRREMMPNSDIDLFVVYDDDNQEHNDIVVHGVDKFEVGHITKSHLGDLLQSSYVDANRFIDGRGIGAENTDDIAEMIRGVSTFDRQHANNLSEYFYYRYFDFPQKVTNLGPNLKYSTGSSRDTIFFNMMGRIETGDFPSNRGDQPEILTVMKQAELNHGIRQPREAANLMFIVKNAAITVFDRTNDPRSKYVSSRGLASIYNFCGEKLKSMGYADVEHFVDSYADARREIEYSVDSLLNSVLNNHPESETLKQIIHLNPREVKQYCEEVINDVNADNPQIKISLSTWMLMRERPGSDVMESVAKLLISHDIERVWGGLMAVICSPDINDEMLAELAGWLYENEKGAYLLKLITRNPQSSLKTKQKALGYYEQKEIIS